MDGKNDIKEKATPPVQEKIARDVQKRVGETIENVRKDLDRAGFDPKSPEVSQAIRRGVDRAYIDASK